MEIMIPKIIDCEMIDCAYNESRECHAAAITVGDMDPVCDTYMKSTSKGGIIDTIGSVGACKVDRCMYNESLECNAEGIHVRPHTGRAECGTFTPL